MSFCKTIEKVFKPSLIYSYVPTRVWYGEYCVDDRKYFKIFNADLSREEVERLFSKALSSTWQWIR